MRIVMIIMMVQITQLLRQISNQNNFPCIDKVDNYMTCFIHLTFYTKRSMGHIAHLFFSWESCIFTSFWSASLLKKANWHNAGVLTSRDARFSLWLKQYKNVRWLVERYWLRPIALQQNGQFLKRTMYPGLSGVAIRIRNPSLFYQKHIYAESKV